ncbi:hypothetical protein NP493_808g00029 [Ridgeia piscesae]|uniref:Uncharacterized protein n=1 Tax=Ridgeia piscesae TaxID=27915 RepID=A0AAD9NMY1_RIDPI|nr:hypothetical protein NP493_5004g00000 [Ridgeia piscesae]KAK2174326.1 hypothetical protein NP493_808g00029 [Ridgeia piscesae]
MTFKREAVIRCTRFSPSQKLWIVPKPFSYSDQVLSKLTSGPLGFLSMRIVHDVPVSSMWQRIPNPVAFASDFSTLIVSEYTSEFGKLGSQHFFTSPQFRGPHGNRKSSLCVRHNVQALRNCNHAIMMAMKSCIVDEKHNRK